jgi:hypothetical protein
MPTKNRLVAGDSAKNLKLWDYSQSEVLLRFYLKVFNEQLGVPQFSDN